jgi:transcriptional regulator with XRE-family HTH domain
MTKSKDLKLTIAENVRRYRNLKDISHDELSELSGLLYETIIDIETGKLEEVSMPDLEAITEALDVNIDDVLKADEYKE